MLVLSRKVGERVMIGKDVSVAVLDIGHGQVRLGLTAPKEVPIVREELLDPEPEEAVPCG